MSATDLIGEPLTRIDGVAKVRGEAKFTAEFQIPNHAYAVLVMSTIASGRITEMKTAEAERASGVIAVITPWNAPRLPGAERRLTILQDEEIFYNDQPIAVVVAESLHQAQYAASLVEARYQTSDAKLDFKAGFPSSYTYSHVGEPGDMCWGDVDAGLAQAAVKIDQIYTTPIQHHNPMEPHATIAQWIGDQLTLYDATQAVTNRREDIARIFGIPPENVRVICLFAGGAFGCKGQTWSHVPLAVLAAKQVNRPVKLVLERPQMFGPVGARPRTHQHVMLGAQRDGKLTAIRHEVHANTSLIENYLESSAFPARVMYACPNISTISRIVPLNLGTPTYMRAPGVATGTYAIEVAMDELAYALGMDPLQLRLVNYAEADPHSQKPFTEKNLRACYERASDKFGWSRRNSEPRSMRDGHELIGWGMATETYPGSRMPASALVRLQPDGRGVVASGTQEIGNGIYTIMAEVAANVLDMPVHMLDVKLGDTELPKTPLSAGSMSTASVLPAVKSAAEQARQELITLATNDRQSPVFGAAADAVAFTRGRIQLKASPERSEAFSAILSRNGGNSVEGKAQANPAPDQKEAPCHSFGAVFAEVAVDEDLGMVRTRRVVAVYDVGKIINFKTSFSQFIGGIVWGISLALFEDARIDERYGRITNANLADYLVPVNADIGDIHVEAIDVPDYTLDSLGARGIGEIGITGTGAAIANAVYHATGKRVRDLPITPDKLL